MPVSDITPSTWISIIEREVMWVEMKYLKSEAMLIIKQKSIAATYIGLSNKILYASLWLKYLQNCQKWKLEVQNMEFLALTVNNFTKKRCLEHKMLDFFKPQILTCGRVAAPLAWK